MYISKGPIDWIFREMMRTNERKREGEEKRGKENIFAIKQT